MQTEQESLQPSPARGSSFGAVPVNVATPERWASAVAGASIMLVGLRQRSWPGLALAAAGGTLLYRGATGHCPMYSKLGLNTAERRSDTKMALAGSGGVRVDQAITIARPIDEVYRFWRALENLPRFMEHLQSVRESNGRSHWVAKGPVGTRVEWDAEIINEIANKVIGWRSLPGSDVTSAGSVNFDPAPGTRGTELKVTLQYDPPAGKLGATVAQLLGEDPSQQIASDLRRLKEILEAGEIPIKPERM